MKRCLYPVKALLAGLIAAQLISTLQVYLSNVNLYQTLVTVRGEGYLAVPNLIIMPTLKRFAPAFFGGLFYTFTVGAGMAILSFIAAWVWDRLFFRNRFVLILIIVLWIVFVVWANMECFFSITTAYYIGVPVVSFFSTIIGMPDQIGESPGSNFLSILTPLLPMMVLFGLWGSQIDKNIFINIRDSLLLTNTVGQKINNFYYKYTLYPAEVIKPLSQKIIRTCRLENVTEKSFARFLERKMLRSNFLVVHDDQAVDMVILQEKDNFIFINNKEEILNVPKKQFLSKSRNILKTFSEKIDCKNDFRKVIYYSLLSGLPIMIYILIYTMACSSTGLFLGFRTSSIFASVMCFLIGVLFLVWFQLGKGTPVSEENIKTVLASEKWEDRVAGLKFVDSQKLEMGDYGYKNMLNSESIPERYWLAKALGTSKKKETYDELLTLLDDPHPNVVCMAYLAIGKRKDKKGIKEILERLKISDHWYQQWYAYKALWAIGWKQTKLTK